MEVNGKQIMQVAVMEVKQEHIRVFKETLKTQIERIETIKKSLKFQEGKLSRLEALTLEQFIEEGR